MSTRRTVAAFCAVAFLLAACGRSGSAPDDAQGTNPTPAPVVTAAPTQPPAPATTAAGGEPTPTPAATTPPTEPPPTTTADPCAGVTLEDTEIGVSAEKVTVLVMADTGSELAPGLFQGSIDGTKAWAKQVNANGGLACREVEVLEWDSKINPTEATNGFLEGCAKALAMVGSTSLFIGDVSILDTCKDKAGAVSGIADIAERAVDPLHQCSSKVFTLAGINGSCPYSGTGVRDYQSFVGPYPKYTEILGEPLHGIYLVPGDLPTTIASSMPTIRGLNQAGLVKSDAEFGVSGRAEQAAFGEYVAAMKTAGSNIAINGSNDQAMIKLRTEAKAQGLDESKILWACSLACYTEGFKNDPNVDGTYIWLPFVPFEERDVNPELDTFLTAMDQDFPQSWSVLAWNAGRLFEQAVNTIVAADGPNGITRARVIEEVGKITAFTNNDWLGAVDLSKKEVSSCYIIMQLTGGEYQRVFPEAPGTMECNDDNIEIWSGDSLAEFKG